MFTYLRKNKAALKKTPLLITIGVLFSICAVYFLFHYFSSQEKKNIWDFIPVNAVIVYESDKCRECQDEIGKSPLLALIVKSLLTDKRDSLRGRVQAIIKEKLGDVIISIHPTKKDQFDAVFYIENFQIGSSTLTSKNTRILSVREFNGVDIHEVTLNNQVFSWITVNNISVGSFTSFLIEDVIRTYKFSESVFKRELKSIQKLPRISGDGGNVYIQLKNISELISVFTDETSPMMERLGQSSILDIKAEQESIVLNGFTVDSADQTEFALSIFRHQEPVHFDQKNLISDRTLFFKAFGISDGAAFKEDVEAFRAKRNVKDSLGWLNQKAGINLMQLYAEIKDEVVECFVESSKHHELKKILIIETRKPEQWSLQLEKIADKLSLDTIFYERYGDFELRDIPVYNFPEKLLWPLTSGYHQTFYTTLKNKIIISDDLSELKKFIDDIESENTWGKSVAYNQFLETTLLESNFSTYVNFPKIWNALSQRTYNRWRAFTLENQKLLKRFQPSAFQFSHLNNTYYTNFNIRYRQVSKSENEDQKSRVTTNFQANISGIYVVKSHVTRNDEVLVQDSVNDLSLIGSDGNPLWKIPVGERIRSEVTQIDYFGNGKLQYFFSTNNTLHIIDRLGKSVDPFPLYVPSLDIAHASVIDYDHTKKYRLLVAERSGKLWMYDKEGQNLEGWNPRDIGGELSSAAEHYRIKGKDYIIAVRKDGQIFVMNRRGENVKGFPLKLTSRINGDFYVDTSTPENVIIVVTQDGYRVRISIDGKILSQEALLKTAVNSSFSLVREKSDKSYVIMQQDPKNFNLVDDAGSTLAMNNYVGGHAVEVSFFDFGADKIFVTISDTVDGMTYVYDQNGELITSPPVETRMLTLRRGGDDQIKLYFARGNAVVMEPLR